jgi:glycosyltransferase involved in cell wall biosynthesis
VCTDKSRVSIGLPVFNGGDYLTSALEGLLTQTFPEFELIISDNASTDDTQEICRTYASRDPRIRYVRNEENIGAAANFNRVFELSTGEYFKWAAHDDLCAPQFLERCVQGLDRDPSVILCYARTRAIDELSRVIKEYPAKVRAGSPIPHERFHEFVCVPHPCVAVFGLIRANVLRRTRLIGSFTGSDRPLLSELSLLGRFCEIPEFLFFYRTHAAQSWRANPTTHAQQAWYDPARARKPTFPHWRLLWEHLRSINRVPLDWQERFACYACMMWWIRLHWRRLASNLILQDRRV